ncbi:MAG: peptide chain release factor 1 [Acidimicrobiia bacterium]|nr:peptide chain release factor 1 [Acidimicrobiia bacterium]
MPPMDERLRGKLEELETKLSETLEEMADPDVLASQDRYREVSKLHSELKPVVDGFRAYQAAQAEFDDATEMASIEDDPEMRAYLENIAAEQQENLMSLETQLRVMLVPKDPNDEKDVILEIRAAAGGEEAALWGADLYRMYERFAERHGWKTEAINTSLTGGGGLKDATFSVKGRGAYSRLKYEAGPHRVQRVPKTESQGRVHTSIATVAVLPEAEDVEVEIHDNDITVDTFRSTGPGGQSVNTTDSAVRITHLPTGTVVTCQDEKSQLQNKLKALRVLRARLYQQQLAEQQGEQASARRSQVGTGERAEKIRTYNFKENRVTDHRVGLTLHSLPEILDGSLDDFHTALIAHDAAESLATEAS